MSMSKMNEEEKQIRFPGQEISRVGTLLSTAKKLIITTHHRPDGDAMGSSLGLYNYLFKKGFEVTVITPSDYPDFLSWLPSNDRVLNYETDRAKADALIQNAEVIFCLDFNWLNRIEKMELPVKKSHAK